MDIEHIIIIFQIIMMILFILILFLTQRFLVKKEVHFKQLKKEADLEKTIGKYFKKEDAEVQKKKFKKIESIKA
ncbi:MAG: hypothetical protein GF364_09430, partial [Candidatus Lokiarchaeota archaeon]|nr:hypothetical protein [Candidatus Lokiarchaeota archaeon]